VLIVLLDQIAFFPGCVVLGWHTQIVRAFIGAWSLICLFPRDVGRIDGSIEQKFEFILGRWLPNGAYPYASVADTRQLI
jgi:hypothetical protein